MANFIYAKVNTGSNALNVLDPNTWIGGVVPGPNDVARFWGPYKSSANEWSTSTLQKTYGNRDANFNSSYAPIYPAQFDNNNTFSSSLWTQEGIDYRTKFNSGNSFSLQVESSVNNFNAYYKNTIYARPYAGPLYYKTWAYTFRVNGVATTTINWNGATVTETDRDEYNTNTLMAASIASKLRANSTFTNTFEVIGPHNGRSVTNSAAELNNPRYITLYWKGGADEDYGTVGPFHSSYGYSISNITAYDRSNYFRAIRHAYTSSNAAAIDYSGSFEYGIGYNVSTGSGEFYAKPKHMSAFMGIGDFIPGILKFKFKNAVNHNYFHSVELDRNYRDFVTSSIVDVPIFTKPSDTNQKINGYLLQTNERIYTNVSLQKYEITGSQHWNVGRIEMSELNQFHIKDSSKITLHDLQEGIYYPSIDITDQSSGDTTLVVTDEATIEVSSSRTTIVPESGIWAAASAISLIISGAANYSSSVSPSASYSGDSTIQITNLNNSFSVGDYITIESTGSLRFSAESEDKGLPYASGSITNYDSFDNLIQRNSGIHSNVLLGNRSAVLVTGSINSNYLSMPTFTHQVENDEVIQIAKIDGDTATVVKFYGKEGEIQSDMGLYSKSDYISTFTSDNQPDNYIGTKRVVLVDSNHKEYQKGDVIVISGSAYNVLHDTTFLSQSLFLDFTQGTVDPNDYFVLNDNFATGSDIVMKSQNNITYNSYGLSSYPYWTEQYKRNRLLITGSFQNGSEKYGTGSLYNGYYADRYGGASGSFNNYYALKLDPTMCARWRNYSHDIVSSHYLRGFYNLKNILWDEGEIIVSGSLIRDGSGDPTSSIGWDPDNSFGILYGLDPYLTSHQNTISPAAPTTNNYVYPYPYASGVRLHGNGPSVHMYGSNHNFVYSLLSNYKVTPRGTGLGNPSIYKPYPRTFESGTNSPTEFDVGHITSSAATGSASIRLTIEKGIVNTFLKIKNVEQNVHQSIYRSGKGAIGVELSKYGSIHSLNVKSRYQLLLLDTQDSFNYRDKIKEGGLLYNHYPNQDIKWYGTEVVDVKGHKNLLWDIEYNKGVSNIRPTQIYKVQYNSANDFRHFQTNYYLTGATSPRLTVSSHWDGGFHNSTNFKIIYDLGQQVEFDTIGIQVPTNASYETEYTINNQINGVRFRVCDDIGVESPAWETVLAEFNDQRLNSFRPNTRFYTFPSGSVNKRFIEFYNAGNTKASTRSPGFFGVYNFSGSALNPPAYNECTDIYGGPTASLCQVELASTSNYSIGDRIYFSNKQLNSPDIFAYLKSYDQYTKSYDVTGYLNGTTPIKQINGGDSILYTITAINGNVVTLDKPISHTHMTAGCMAVKQNRGKINLNGVNRSTLFRIYSSTGTNTFLCQNFSMKRGAVFSGNGLGAIRYFSDFGTDVPSENYIASTQYWGLVKNQVTHGNSNLRGSSYTSTTNYYSNFQAFNILSSYNITIPTIGINTTYTKLVYNFINFKRTATPFPLTPSYNQSLNPIYGQIFLRNIYAPGPAIQEIYQPSPDGAVSTNYDKYIHLDNIIQSPTDLNPVYNGPGGNNLINNVNIPYKLNIFNSFGFPSAGNMQTMKDYVYINTNSNDNTNNVNRSSGPSLGTFMPKESNPNYKYDHILIGSAYRNFKAFKITNDGFIDIFNNSTYNYSTYSSYGKSVLFICSFQVTQTCDIKLDLNFQYKVPIYKKYNNGGTGAASPQYNMHGANINTIYLMDTSNQKILDVDYIYETSTTQFNKSTLHNLSPGFYEYAFEIPRMHSSERTGLSISLKDVVFNIVTNNLNNIEIISNNWDVLNMFNKEKRNTNYLGSRSLPTTVNAGQHKVLKQSSDLTSTIKFNKIKL